MHNEPDLCLRTEPRRSPVTDMLHSRLAEQAGHHEAYEAYATHQQAATVTCGPRFGMQRVHGSSQSGFCLREVEKEERQARS